jgi:hypothetical protein
MVCMVKIAIAVAVTAAICIGLAGWVIYLILSRDAVAPQASSLDTRDSPADNARPRSS